MSALWRQRTHCLCPCHPGTQHSADAGPALDWDLLLELDCLLWSGLVSSFHPGHLSRRCPSHVSPCSAQLSLSPPLSPPARQTGLQAGELLLSALHKDLLARLAWGLGRLWQQVCNLGSDRTLSLWNSHLSGDVPGWRRQVRRWGRILSFSFSSVPPAHPRA